MFVRKWVSIAPAWRGATCGVALAAGVVWTTFSLAAFAPAGPIALIAGWLGGLLAGALLGGLIALLGALLRRVPARFIWAVIGALPLLALAYLALPLAFGMLAVIAGVIGIGALLGASVAVSIHAARLAPARRLGGVFGLGLGLLGLAAGCDLLLSDGFNPAVLPRVDAASSGHITPLDLPDPSQPGPYAARMLTYGSGVDLRRPEYGTGAVLRTTPVDGARLLDGWSVLRRAYWGFGPEAMPINARVWYPDGDGPFPLIVIAHGNHPMELYSEAGYDYLAKVLASRGYIVASIDQNFLNLSFVADLIVVTPLTGENDARAWLILEHLRQWRLWNDTAGNPFYRKVDMNRIGLIGHSRGGEAVAIAATFNRLPCHPDDGSMRFDYGFGIQAVAAIAPVDGQYRPGDRWLPLQDVNYLVLHGAHDMDVATFSGARQYARLTFSGDCPLFKAALYIYGANHGQFNQDWGRRDMLGPAAQLFNLRVLMSPARQERIAKIAISAFMDAALRGEAGYRTLFRDPRTVAAWLPDTIYINRYEDSDTMRVCDFEEDIDLSTCALPGAVLRSENLTTWREQIVSLKWGALENAGVYLEWDHAMQPGVARFALSLPEAGLTVGPRSWLRFSMADADEIPHGAASASARASTDAVGIELTLEVVDRAGQKARLPLSHFARLQPQLRSRLGKLDWMSVLPLSEPVYQTFEFRLADFMTDNPDFDPAALAEVRFVFDRTQAGAVVLDDIGFGQ